MTIHPFPAIADEWTKVLLLGSFPSLVSVQQNFYYAHPRNQFWPIMEELFELHLPTVDEKKKFLSHYGIGLWDAIASCQRSNSSDTNLTHIVPNPVPSLLETYPKIVALGMTGGMAMKLVKKYALGGLRPLHQLPSTSPAYAAVSMGEKKEVYRAFFRQYGVGNF